MKKGLNKAHLLPIAFVNSNGNSIKIDKVVKMTGLEYLCGLIVLLFGFNIGYYEAGKGLSNEDLKNLYKKVVGKLKK
ncbi:MAG: hypothetical protein E2O76_12140 [Caldithrix sp.]|nr:MAG: hypothetical protein E2O76_12140 [Caldithrix sp.]